MSKYTISLGEPADRPIKIDLSLAEVNALIVHHKNRMEQCVKSSGKIMAKECLNLCQMEHLQKITKDQIVAHKHRALNLKLILASTLENQP